MTAPPRRRRGARSARRVERERRAARGHGQPCRPLDPRRVPRRLGARSARREPVRAGGQGAPERAGRGACPTRGCCSSGSRRAGARGGPRASSRLRGRGRSGSSSWRSSIRTICSTSTSRRRSPAATGRAIADLFLVCTHGKRDRCCALHGRPALRRAAARPIPPARFGSRRTSAATASPATSSCSRTGLYYGRVAPGRRRGVLARRLPESRARALPRAQRVPVPRSRPPSRRCASPRASPASTTSSSLGTGARRRRPGASASARRTRRPTNSTSPSRSPTSPRSSRATPPSPAAPAAWRGRHRHPRPSAALRVTRGESLRARGGARARGAVGVELARADRTAERLVASKHARSSGAASAGKRISLPSKTSADRAGRLLEVGDHRLPRLEQRVRAEPRERAQLREPVLADRPPRLDELPRRRRSTSSGSSCAAISGRARPPRRRSTPRRKPARPRTPRAHPGRRRSTCAPRCRPSGAASRSTTSRPGGASRAGGRAVARPQHELVGRLPCSPSADE